MRKTFLIILGFLIPLITRGQSETPVPTTTENSLSEQNAAAMTTAPVKTSVKKGVGEYAVVHSAVGDESNGVPGKIKLRNIAKKQQFSAAQKDSYDTDINSPKSVTFSPDGKYFYVNSLEGCKTVVYDAATFMKVKVIEYKFDNATGPLWAKPSGYYNFSHYKDGISRKFMGKPVESTWSHNGRYLWVPFYRRTFDINAQDPSAVAVIDTRTHTIVRMFETGPIPKMVATSNNNKLLAVTHWGDNTVGFIDISSDNPAQWRHLPPITVGHKFNPNYSLTTPVNRDSGSGNLLRGTVFTPDDRYMLVSEMSGCMAVVDVVSMKYLGTVPQLPSIRHLVIYGVYVYGSMNSAGMVVKFKLSDLIDAIVNAKSSESKSIQLRGKVERCKVGGGARTLEISPDGKYLFVACNSGNAVYVVDAQKMEVVDHIRCDSYPVGLAISNDGRRLIVTSQGRKTGGGNAVNIFEIERPDLPAVVVQKTLTDTTAADSLDNDGNDSSSEGVSGNMMIYGGIILIVIALAIILSMVVIRNKKQK